MLQSRKYRRNANLRGTQLSARGRCIIRRSARIASSKLVSCNGLFIVVPERKAVGRVLRQMIFSDSYVPTARLCLSQTTLPAGSPVSLGPRSSLLLALDHGGTSRIRFCGRVAGLSQ